jgi:hypothetical protein
MHEYRVIQYILHAKRFIKQIIIIITCESDMFLTKATIVFHAMLSNCENVFVVALAYFVSA